MRRCMLRLLKRLLGAMLHRNCHQRWLIAQRHRSFCFMGEVFHYVVSTEGIGN